MIKHAGWYIYFRCSVAFRYLKLLHVFLIYLHFDITAKVAAQGSSVEGESQLDKNCGDHKKPDAEKNNCRCACHNKTNTTTATSAAGPAVVDLTQSPCKGFSEPATSAAEHGKQFSMSGVLFLLLGITDWTNCAHLFSMPLSLFIYYYYIFDQKRHKKWLFSQLGGADPTA